MVKSIWLKVLSGIGGVVIAMGVDGVFSFFPNTAWGQSHVGFALAISILLIIIGTIIVITFWVKGVKEQKNEEILLIKRIPETLNAINLINKKVVDEISTNISNENYLGIANDIFQHISGINIESEEFINAFNQAAQAVYDNLDEIDNVNSKINEINDVKKIKHKIANFNMELNKLSELELSKIIHIYVDKYTHIENKLERNRKYKSLAKTLKYQREHFRSVAGTKAINNYIDYVRGYNEVEVLLAYSGEIGSYIPQADKIFRSYKNNVKHDLFVELSKVGETING